MNATVCVSMLREFQSVHVVKSFTNSVSDAPVRTEHSSGDVNGCQPRHGSVEAFPAVGLCVSRPTVANQPQPLKNSLILGTFSAITFPGDEEGAKPTIQGQNPQGRVVDCQKIKKVWS